MHEELFPWKSFKKYIYSRKSKLLLTDQNCHLFKSLRGKSKLRFRHILTLYIIYEAFLTLATFFKRIEKGKFREAFQQHNTFYKKIFEVYLVARRNPYFSAFLSELSLCCLLTLEKDKSTGTLPKEEKKGNERVNNKRNERITPII